FFIHYTPPPRIYTLSLHDALPISGGAILVGRNGKVVAPRTFGRQGPEPDSPPIRPDAIFLLASITKPVVYMGALMLVERGLLNRSEEHTSELQSRFDLVCRLLLEK